VIDLPKPVAGYFDAERARDVRAQMLCFSEDAFVHDEGRDYRGLVAIAGWKRTVWAKFEY